MAKVFVTACIGMMMLAAAPVGACQIPVFRYALERWEPAAYEVVVFHRGPLSTADRGLIAALKSASYEGKGHSNHVVRTVDAGEKLDKDVAALLDAQKPTQLPWMVVVYPDFDGRTPAVWSGPLSADAVKAVSDSPTRRLIGHRILKGESAVWVLVESGDKKADDAAAKLLENELAEQTKSLKLPDLAAEEGPRLLSALKVRIAFSVLRVSRQEPAEAILVSMLRNADADSRAATGPMVFAVFGRGRALGPLTGKELSAKVIAQVCEFLIGECSCQVKEQNPGFDLLIPADWESILEGAEVPGGSKPATMPAK